MKTLEEMKEEAQEEFEESGAWALFWACMMCACAFFSVHWFIWTIALVAFVSNAANAALRGSTVNSCRLLEAERRYRARSPLSKDEDDDDNFDRLAYEIDRLETNQVTFAPPRGSRDRLFGPDWQPESERTHEYWNGSRVRHRLLPDRSPCPIA